MSKLSLNHEEFLNKLKEKYPNLLDKLTFVTKYISSKSDIIVNDGIGDLITKPESLLQGDLPGISKAINKNKYFAIRAAIIHRNKYDYSKVNYIKSKGQIIIICPIHGEFIQTADNHYAGYGCPKCAKDQASKNKLSNTEKFTQKARLIHGNLYDYSKINYISAKNKITITCPIHGDFVQTPSDHLSGNGCKKCTKTGFYSSYRAIFHPEWSEKQARIYLIKCTNNKEAFYKIGLTTLTENIRFSGNKLPYNYEIIQSLNTTLYDACFIEKFSHEDLDKFKYNPLISFKGSGECFNCSEEQCLNTIKLAQEKYSRA